MPVKFGSLSETKQVFESEQIFKRILQVLALFGTDIRSKTGYWQRRISVVFTLTLVVLTLSFNVYGWIHGPKHLPNYSAIAFTLGGLVSHFSIWLSGRDVLRTMDYLLVALNDDVKKVLKRHDRFVVFIIAAKTCWCVVYAFILPFGYGSHEFSTLMFSYPIPNNTVIGHLLESAVVLSQLHYICLLITASMFYCCSFHILKHHADAIAKCAAEAMHERRDHYGRANLLALVKSLYRAHWRSKSLLNHQVGIIPFCLFGTIFVLFTAGISFVIISKIKLSTFFLLTCVIGCTLYLVVLCYYISWHASRSSAAQHSAIAAIGELCSDSDGAVLPGSAASVHRPEPDAISKARQGLYRYVMTHPFEPASAFGAFDVDCSILISFPNVVVPFSVMIISSAALDLK